MVVFQEEEDKHCDDESKTTRIGLDTRESDWIQQSVGSYLITRACPQLIFSVPKVIAL